MSLKALVTMLLLGSSSAVFAHPAPTKVVERTRIMRGDRNVEQVRVDYTSYDRDRGDRWWSAGNFRERGHGRHIDNPRGRVRR